MNDDKNGWSDTEEDLKTGDASNSDSLPLLCARTFTMEIEPHTPRDIEKPCYDCVLGANFSCLDRSYCEVRKTGKTWKKASV